MTSTSQQDRNPLALLKQPQLFVKLGKNRYAPIEPPYPDKDLYMWDDLSKRIVPYAMQD